MFVNVGLGFHVEFTPKEALSFIELKEAHLTGYGRCHHHEGNHALVLSLLSPRLGAGG